VDYIPCEESKLDSKFCWNDDHLKEGLIHHIDSDFYTKHIKGTEASEDVN
jgi:hypothetical protein